MTKTTKALTNLVLLMAVLTLIPPALPELPRKALYL